MLVAILGAIGTFIGSFFLIVFWSVVARHLFGGVIHNLDLIVETIPFGLAVYVFIRLQRKNSQKKKLLEENLKWVGDSKANFDDVQDEHVQVSLLSSCSDYYSRFVGQTYYIDEIEWDGVREKVSDPRETLVVHKNGRYRVEIDLGENDIFSIPLTKKYRKKERVYMKEVERPNRKDTVIVSFLDDEISVEITTLNRFGFGPMFFRVRD